MNARASVGALVSRVPWGSGADGQRPLPPADHPRDGACLGCPGVSDRRCCKTDRRPGWVLWKR